MFPTRDLNDGDIKYASRSRALVIDNRDPQKRGRIRVEHPLMGKTVWIPYINNSITFDPPAIGDVVYVEADAGYYTHAIAHGNLITGDDGEPNIPDEFQREVPSNRGFYTPEGHLIELDDGESLPATIPDDTLLTTKNRGIRITTSDGSKVHLQDDLLSQDQGILIEDAGENSITLDYSTAGKFIALETAGGHSIEMNDLPTEKGIIVTTDSGHKIDLNDTTSGKGVLIETSSGHSIEMDDIGNSITVTDISGNTIETTATGITITDSFGNTVETTSSGIKLTEFTTGELNLSGGKVALGATTAELLDLFDQTLAQILALTVGTGVGPSSPPINSAAFTAIKTQLATIKGSL